MFKKLRAIFVLAIPVLFFSLNCSAQMKYPEYTGEWKKVDEMVSKGLTKSALAEVDKIYALAKKEGNDVQVIKSLISRLSLNQNLQEEAGVKNIAALEKEIPLTKEPARSILSSVCAEMYWNYFQQNRWKFYNRTKTQNFIKTDIQTWSADDFHKKISELYVSSIKEQKLLQQSRLDKFDPVLVKGNVRYLRPTLYDLLVQEALQYFKSTERDIRRPAYAFEIKDEKAFAPASEFITHTFINKDSASLQYKALEMFKQLLAFHTGDAKPEALIDADIDRLEFVRQNSVIPGKDELYIKALQNIAAGFSGNPASAQAIFLVAQEIFNQANATVKGTDTISKYTLVQAKELAESLINKFPGSEGGVNARNLLTQILHKDITLTSEKVNIPGQSFRTLVNYKNVSSINMRIIELTPGFKTSLEDNTNNYDNDQLWKKLIAQKFIRSWQQKLPSMADYDDHSVEIRIDALPVGQYALLSSVAGDFSLNKNPLAVQYFHVSGISYVNDGPEYFVLNRATGKPLPGARVQVWKQVYDYKFSKNTLQKEELISTDKNGHFTVTEVKNKQGKFLNENRNIRLEITFQEDKLFLDDNQNNYRYYNNNDDDNEDEYAGQKEYDAEKAKIFLFTDRSIYRPGQLVYFKGIGVTKDVKTHRSALLAGNDSLTVKLIDANRQPIDSMKLLLNEYGSINGHFQLPENKLNGEFSITVGDYQDASITFSVEEYKRPKFYVEFEKVKGTYRVSDKVKISGFAKGYAGNNIDGGVVKYRVTRVARFLHPWMFWRTSMPRTQPLEIANGEIKTSAGGKFYIEFEAIPDLSIDKKNDPVFDYKIVADVTDINGETRSTSATVPVGYKSLNLQLTLPAADAINADSLGQIIVSSRNLSGVFEPTKVDLKIWKLRSPDRLIRTRYWQQPDQFVMSKEEFLQYFPNDEYLDESKKENWIRQELISSNSDSTSLAGNWKLDIKNPRQGWYVAEATAHDKYGQEVKDIKYFQLYDLKASSIPAPGYSWNTVIKNTNEPGEKASFITGTSATDLFIVQQVIKLSDNPSPAKVSYTFYTLNNEKKTLNFDVKEEDRGGFGVNQFFVKDNRVYTNTFNVSVPWTNKQLDITYQTFRDKTLPGSNEKWKVKISGSKGEKVAAEMLAGMYDASLDQFKPHSWTVPGIWPVYSNYNGWSSVQNFSTVQSMQRWFNEEYVQQKEKIYDQLMSGSDNYRNRMAERSISARAPGVVANQSMNAPSADQSITDIVVTGVGMAKKAVTGAIASISIRGAGSLDLNNKELIVVDGLPFKGLLADLDADDISSIEVLKGEQAEALYGAQAANGVILITTKSGLKQKQALADIKTRKNFNETAFFFPELRTDKEGNIEFSFIMPEALTQWKLMTLAHTKDLSMGYAVKSVVTQKELMVQPNTPRFLREGDTIEFSAKIVNLGTKQISGNAQLQLFTASTMQPVDVLFKNVVPQRPFGIEAGQSAAVLFKIVVPVNYNNALVYRIVAKAGDNSDGEEAAMPVLTNRMLVTETMPLPVKGNDTKNFTFDKLLHSGNSTTLSNHALSMEFTTNPAWYAVQALPYLMEFPYECSEQNFNRYYANSLATRIVNASPKIKAIFQKWASASPVSADADALLSNLEKNQELKSVLLEETPWVLEAQNEAGQKKNIALLFDMVRMSASLESSLAELKEMQAPNGGFVWFKGGPDDRYITQYIVTGIGHLKKLNAISTQQDQQLSSILNTAIPYLDRKMKQDYDNLKKYRSNTSNNNLSAINIQFLYMRSFFPGYPLTKETGTAYNYYVGQSKKYWLSERKYMQAMIALSLYRINDKTTPRAIIRSLKENSINNEELGMYWKEFNEPGYYWYHAPIESQSMMIEAFNEIDKDVTVVDDLKTWLLKNKQTNNWHTSKATAEACYALLLQGTDWLSEEKNVSIKLGNITINSNEENQQAGTGYFKTKINGDQITPDMGNISVSVVKPTGASEAASAGVTSTAYGAVYWQYFENLDKISFSETPLKLTKKLFTEKNSDRGPVLNPVAASRVKVGDKIKVRIELRVDRDMEYVHMKDMRAAGMEPTNVISAYKYQDALGYYETTKDASTNFFFNYLPKGTYVFEYSLFVTHTGNFSNGITSIQCMYAPEFTAHSEGTRIEVGE